MFRCDWWVLLVPVLWGTMPAAATVAFSTGHPLLIATVRSFGAGLVIVLVCRRFPPLAWCGRVVALGTINIALVFALFFVSSARLGGLVTLFMALSPFWAALLGRPVLGEPIYPMRVTLILAGVSGIALLLGAAPTHLDPIGVLAGLSASICMGSGIVLFRKWGRPAGLLIFTGWQLLVGGTLLAVVLAFGVEELPTAITPKAVAALLYLVSASTILAYTLWFRGIEQIGAQRTSMLLLSVPVVGLGIDAVLFGKRLLVTQYLGGLVVLTSLFVDTIHSARTKNIARTEFKPKIVHGERK